MANPDIKYPDIATQFGVSESMLYRICKEYDIRRNKSRAQDTVLASDSASAFSEPVNKNLQNLSQSLLGVCSFFEEWVYSPQDGVIQAYLDLYSQVTMTKRRQKQIPGQIGFRFRDTGECEFYCS